MDDEGTALTELEVCSQLGIFRWSDLRLSQVRKVDGNLSVVVMLEGIVVKSTLKHFMEYSPSNDPKKSVPSGVFSRSAAPVVGFPAAGHRSVPLFRDLGSEQARHTRYSRDLRGHLRETGIHATRDGAAAAIVWQRLSWTRSDEGNDEHARYTLAEIFQWIRSEFSPQAVYGWHLLARLLRLPPAQLIQEAHQINSRMLEDPPTRPEDIRYEGFLELLLSMRVWAALRDALCSRNRNILEAAIVCIDPLLDRFFDSSLFDRVDELIFEDDVDHIGGAYESRAFLDFWACMEPLHHPEWATEDDQGLSGDELGTEETAGAAKTNSPRSDDDWVAEIASMNLMGALLQYADDRHRLRSVDIRAARSLYFLLWVVHPYLQLSEAARLLARLLSFALKLLEGAPFSEEQRKDRIIDSDSNMLLTTQVYSLRAAAVLAMDPRLEVSEQVRFALQQKLDTLLVLNDRHADRGVRKLLRSLQALGCIIERNHA